MIFQNVQQNSSNLTNDKFPIVINTMYNKNCHLGDI